MGRDFRWLWAAFAASTAGTWLAFDAFPLIAVRVLHAGAFEVSLLAAAGRAAGALLAVPLGPWVEFRRKRPVMIGMDLVRFGALLTIPLSFALGLLQLWQLIVVSVVVAAADIAFRAASGACLKTLVGPDELLRANGRFEATTWTATAIGPPAGGLAIAVFGPVTTIVVDAASYAASALGIRMIRAREPRPEPRDRLRMRDVSEGWRYILAHPVLRRLFANTCLVNGLILAGGPLLVVLLVGELGFALWQYGLAFGVPCVGGLLGSRLAWPLVTRYGQHRVLRVAGVARVCTPVGLAFVPAGVPGLVLVMVLEFVLITSMGVFNPVFATYRLEQTDDARVARTLSAWSVTNGIMVALLIVSWGLLADLAGTRVAIAAAGLLLLVTPVLLPRKPGAAGTVQPGEHPAEHSRLR